MAPLTLRSVDRWPLYRTVAGATEVKVEVSAVSAW